MRPASQPAAHPPRALAAATRGGASGVQQREQIDHPAVAADGPDTIALPASLDAAAADDLQRRLQDLLGRQRPVTLDGSGVERVSTLALQVLLTARRGAGSRGLAFRIAPLSPPLSEAIDRLGLRHALSA